MDWAKIEREIRVQAMIFVQNSTPNLLQEQSDSQAVSIPGVREAKSESSFVQYAGSALDKIDERFEYYASKIEKIEAILSRTAANDEYSVLASNLKKSEEANEKMSRTLIQNRQELISMRDDIEILRSSFRNLSASVEQDQSMFVRKTVHDEIVNNLSADLVHLKRNFSSMCDSFSKMQVVLKSVYDALVTSTGDLGLPSFYSASTHIRYVTRGGCWRGILKYICCSDSSELSGHLSASLDSRVLHCIETKVVERVKEILKATKFTGTDEDGMLVC